LHPPGFRSLHSDEACARHAEGKILNCHRPWGTWPEFLLLDISSNKTIP
jgi:hypothetical protein